MFGIHRFGLHGLLMNEADAPGENGGVGDGGSAPVSFDSVAEAMFKSVNEAAAKDDVPSSSSSGGAQAPVADATQAASGQTASSNSPPAASPSGAGVTNQATQQPDYMQTMVQQNQMLMQQMAQQHAQMMQQFAPKPAAAAPPEPVRPPTAGELAKSFRAPDRKQGEAESDYLARAQGEMLDHINGGIIKHMEKVQETKIKEAIDTYQQSINQQASMSRAQDAWNHTLDASLREAGFDPASEMGRHVRESVDQQLRFRAAQLGERATQISDPQWKQGMVSLASRFKSMQAPVQAAVANPAAGQPAVIVPPSSPGQAPSLRLVAPISGGGTTTVTQPGSGTSPIPKNYTEAMDSIWGGVTKSQGQS